MLLFAIKYDISYFEYKLKLNINHCSMSMTSKLVHFIILSFLYNNLRVIYEFLYFYHL